MKCGGSGRLVLACAVSIALLLGMTACGGGTVGYLWVLAGKASSNTAGDTITGYKIDNYTGNLTEIVNSPFVTGAGGAGEIPVYGRTSSDGRYLYIVNQGDPSSSLVQYSVGGDGVLTPVTTYGSVGHTPAWMDFGSGYVYVLDTVSPALVNGVAPACASLTNPKNTAPCGSVEVFSISTDGTGRLTPVTNTAIKVNNVGISYFPTGPAPTRMKFFGGALLIVNGDNTITSYIAASNGQLTASANSTQVLDASTLSGTNISSITASGSYLYLTDSGNNRIFQYSVSSGVLQPVTGSPYTNLASNTEPVWTVTTTDSSGNTFLYVLNSGSTSTLTATGSISVYQVLSSGRLSAIASTSNPFVTGANPVCLVVDPSNKYMYSSNADGTVTGYELVLSEGVLSPLRRGSQFTVAGKPTCLVTSGILS